MSCKACDEFQDSDQTSYFRWGTANIEVRACKKHLGEVYAALRKAQSDKRDILEEISAARAGNDVQGEMMGELHQW
jgi:hypothetical protein